jgi:hypothetical protein
VQRLVQRGTPQQFVNADARAHPRVPSPKVDSFHTKCSLRPTRRNAEIGGRGMNTTVELQVE